MACQLVPSFDPVLMAVSLGSPVLSSSSRPGGRFGDYWQLGLPLQTLAVGVAVPVLLVVWRL